MRARSSSRPMTGQRYGWEGQARRSSPSSALPIGSVSARQRFSSSTTRFSDSSAPAVSLSDGDAVRFEPQHQLERGRRDGLVVAGVVGRGVGVRRAPLGLDQAVVLLRSVVLGPGEHEVLEEMGDAGDARALVDRAGPVPDGHVHGAGGRVGREQEPHAVLERHEPHVGGRGDSGGRGRGRCAAIARGAGARAAAITRSTSIPDGFMRRGPFAWSRSMQSGGGPGSPQGDHTDCGAPAARSPAPGPPRSAPPAGTSIVPRPACIRGTPPGPHAAPGAAKRAPGGKRIAAAGASVAPRPRQVFPGPHGPARGYRMTMKRFWAVKEPDSIRYM